VIAAGSPVSMLCMRRYRWFGVLLLLNFALVAAVKIKFDIAADLLWMSHVALLLAGVGLVCGRMLLVTATLVSVFLLHAIWLADCIAWLLTGHFPIGVTRYLAGADGLTWVATAHHFYLMPLLIVIIAKCHTWPKEALPVAICLFLYLTVVSRVVSPRDLNVNYAFGTLTAVDHPVVNWVNRLPGSLYLLTLNVVVTALMFVPVHLLGRWWAGRRRSAQKNARGRSARKLLVSRPSADTQTPG